MKPVTSVQKKTSWKTIFGILEAWRAQRLLEEEPAVSAVARTHSEKPAADRAWAVLVSTILSLRTKDEVTRAASAALLDKAPNPRRLLTLEEAEIARLAYPAGFYRVKAAQLRKIAAILLERYNGLVPANMDELLALPGVGRKTANLVLTEAFDMDAICVDVHVHRICNRAGWITTKNPEATEMVLREILPQQFWKSINGLLVQYGQNICRPVSPFCSKCAIRDFCTRQGIDRSR